MSQLNVSSRVLPPTAKDLVPSNIVPTIATVTIALGFVLQMLGAATNYISIVVFCRAGLRDSVSLSFFVLSLSDFVYMLSNGLGSNLCQLVGMADPGNLVAKDFGVFGNFFIWYIVVFKDYTLTVSAFIAVARCCLVSLPLQFRSVFTLYRTSVSLLVIFIIMVVIHMPMLFTQGLEFSFDLRTNTTRLVSWQGASRKETLAFHDLVVRNIVPYSCIIIIALCLIILTSKLFSASKFRKSLTKVHTDTCKEKFAEGELSSRDIRVIKAVCFISGSYFIGFLPTAMQSIFRVIFPEFNLGKTYSNSFVLLLCFAVIITYFNSTINIVFYWTYNTKYREQLVIWCSRTKKI
ncbi:neuromedin-U receptor 1 [Biomphalaria pfeifferi]|uniref:Neuromedin-U receptor 1 n=1 Tax=Biomphalaria pfeifferi TaxID=112525 RepID=A0AAD8F8Y9_BIOPF|nr:neuromedin-U receptor 1 [Biomphalaria pfeifferi]